MGSGIHVDEMDVRIPIEYESFQDYQVSQIACGLNHTLFTTFIEKTFGLEKIIQADRFCNIVIYCRE